jgi:hypothetical protein
MLPAALEAVDLLEAVEALYTQRARHRLKEPMAEMEFTQEVLDFLTFTAI